VNGGVRSDRLIHHVARPSRPLPRLVAVLVPLLALGLAARHITRDAAPTGRALLIDRRLVDEPAVLVLGSSLARADVLPEVVAEALGLPEGSVEVLTIPNATMPHVYAILAHRVYGNHHRPAMVIVAGALTSMITPDVLKDMNVDRLMNLVDRYDPVLATKVFDGRSGSFAWYLNRERAGRMRDRLLDGWRDHWLALLFGTQHEAWEGARLAARVDEVVYAPERMDRSLHRAAPTGMYAGAVEEITLDGVDPERDSLLPETAALAAAHGTRLVFVRTPFPPSNADNDLVAPELEAAATATLAHHGALWLDLRAMGLPEEQFQDMRHMTPEGAERFTRHMAAEILRAYDVEGPSTQLLPTTPEIAPAPCDQVVQRALEAAAANVRVAPPLLPGEACAPRREVRWADDPTGPPSWWVLPGETATWALPPGTERARVSGHLGDTAERFERTVPGDPDAPWTLLPSACPTCPPALRLRAERLTLVDHMVATGPDGDRFLVGRPETQGPHTARLLGGRVEDTTLRAEFAAPPPPLPAVAPRKAPQQTGVFVLPTLAPLADAAETLASRPDRCSPVRVLEDGAPLPRPHERCPDVSGLRAGRTCHAGEALYFSASDSLPPAGTGRSYTVALDPSRLCDARGVAVGTPLRGLLWLYPGDVVRLTVSREQLLRLRDGLLSVVVDASAPIAGPSPALTVRLVSDTGELARGALQGSRAALALDHPRLDVDAPIYVELVNDAETWWLVQRVLLSSALPTAPAAAQASAAPDDPLGLLGR
jgi:hypothetical protein